MVGEAGSCAAADVLMELPRLVDVDDASLSGEPGGSVGKGTTVLMMRRAVPVMRIEVPINRIEAPIMRVGVPIMRVRAATART